MTAARVGRSAACAALVALALGGLALGGCSGDFGFTVRRCLPAALEAPAIARAGETITVSSPAADCALGYEAGRTYTMVISHRTVTSPAVTVEPDQYGAFTAELPIPADFPIGQGYVRVTGSPYDDCDDGGSCVGYSIAVTVD